MKIKTRFISMITVFTMIMGFMPVMANAAGNKLTAPSNPKIVDENHSEYGVETLVFSPSSPSDKVEEYEIRAGAILKNGITFIDDENCTIDSESIILTEDFEWLYEDFCSNYNIEETIEKPFIAMRAISNDTNYENSDFITVDFDYKEIKLTNLANGKCGASAFWKISDDGTLTVMGSGEVDYIWLEDTFDFDKVKKIVLEEGITAADLALERFENLKSIYIYNKDFDFKNDSSFFPATNIRAYIHTNGTAYKHAKKSIETGSTDVYAKYIDIDKYTGGIETIIDSSYIDAVKFTGDIGLIAQPFLLHGKNVTKEQLALTMAKFYVPTKLLRSDSDSEYSDLQDGTLVTGAANYMSKGITARKFDSLRCRTGNDL